MRKSVLLLVVLCLAAVCLSPALAGEAGKDEGGSFYVREGDYSLNVSTLIQIRGDYTDDELTFTGPLYVDEPNIDYDAQGDFLVRRARLRFFGQAGAPWLSYMVDTDLVGKADTTSTLVFDAMTYDTRLSPELRDAWLRFRIGERHSVTVGQQKDPFDYFFQEYSRDGMFLERPYLTESMGPGRQVGVLYSGGTKSGRFGWDVMLSNGSGANRQGNDNDKFSYSGRIYLESPGFFGSGMTALPGTYDGRRYGLGVALHHNSVGDNFSCSFSDSTLNCGYDTDSLSAYEFFGGLAGSRARVNWSYQTWTVDNAGFDPMGRPDDLQLDSYTVEGGVFVHDHAELALRYESSTTDPLDMLFLGELQSETETTGVTAGFNYYFFGNHNFKLQVNVGQLKTTYTDVLSDDYLAKAVLARGEVEGKSNFIRIGLQHAF